MSLVANFKRAYGCPYGAAELLRSHFTGAETSPFAEAVFGFGPMRVHFDRNMGWMLDNKPIGPRGMTQAWHDHQAGYEGWEFFA